MLNLQIIVYIREWIIGQSGRKYGAQNDHQNTAKKCSSQWNCTKLRMIDAFVEKHGINMEVLQFFLPNTKEIHLNDMLTLYRYKLYPCEL